MKIKIFNDVWYTCDNAILNDIIFSIDENRLDLIYNNAYRYVEMPIEINENYKSFQTESTNQDDLFNFILQNIDEESFTSSDLLIKRIVELLNNDYVILANVDMYYYLPELHGIYHKNHITHASFIHNYNQADQTFDVYEKEGFSIGFEQLANACLQEDGRIFFAQINTSVSLPPVTLDDIKKQAQIIINSIDALLLNEDNYWNFISPSQTELEYILSRLSTHLENLRCRYRANKWLYAHIIHPDSKENPFEELENNIIAIRARLIKFFMKCNLDGVMIVKKNVFEIIRQERSIWESIL